MCLESTFDDHLSCTSDNPESPGFIDLQVNALLLGYGL
jgi:hypothetical protein